MITVNGKLVAGIEYEGKIYRDFTLRVLTIRGEMAALDALEQEAGTLEETPPNLSDGAADIMENMAYLSQQLSLAGLPDDVMTLPFF